MIDFYLPALKLLHYVLISTFLGGQFYYLLILQPASFDFFSKNEQIRFLQNVLKKQNPVLLLVLCLIVLTGGFMITPLKSSLGTDYYAAFGAKLVWKLVYFFMVFFVTAYQTLAVGFRIRFLSPEGMQADLSAHLRQVRVLMTVTCVLNIIIMSWILYYVLIR